MKVLYLFIALLFSLADCLAQDTTLVLNTRMFSPDQLINLSTSTGWLYHPGHNPAWAKPGLNTTGWRKRPPAGLSVKDADETGRAEGWFRLKICLDATFMGMPLSLKKFGWSAADVYLDGQLLTSLGSTGAFGKPYQEYNVGFWDFGFDPPFLVDLIPQREHLLAIHWVDYVSPLSPTDLKSSGNRSSYLLFLLGPQGTGHTQEQIKADTVYLTIWLVVSLLMTALACLLPFQSVHEKNTVRLLIIWGTLYTIQNLSLFIEIFNARFEIQFITFYLSWFLYYLTVAISTISLSHILGRPLSARFSSVLIVISIIGGVWTIYAENNKAGSVANILQCFVTLWLLITSWKNVRGAQWATVIGTVLSLFFYLAYASGVFGLAWFDEALVQTGAVISVPLAFLVYIVLRFRETLAEVREKATAVVQITEEKRQLLAHQNERLEHQVEARTAELNQSLTELRTAQTQLIQKEKLASLGELTAGIAHEIQNPLNFVNNFSEVSTELVYELREEETKAERDPELIGELLDDLTQNLQKITLHGGRASSIVKGMLEHSRPTTGERQPMDLNALADEYLRLAYQGLRVKDKAFACELVTDFDPRLGLVEVVPQEIGRVLLNLYNNAFYAVQQKQKTAPMDYQPTVSVRTQRGESGVEIRVRDNGSGISESVKAKIFQPFFTTKPTGEGTGLGLSLSYDIVTKGHGGSLIVESQEGEGTEFIITLPVTTNQQ